MSRSPTAWLAALWIVTLLAIAIVQARRIDYLEGRIAHAEDALVAIELEHATSTREHIAMARFLGELQSWRVHVTLASRMGWSSANRYIRDYPLELGGELVHVVDE